MLIIVVVIVFCFDLDKLIRRIEAALFTSSGTDVKTLLIS